MATDFWAGYASGAVGIVIGNPLDIVKLRLQTQHLDTRALAFQNTKSLLAGTTAPIMGYGALNAILFVSYNRTEVALNQALGSKNSLGVSWIAGAVGGLATWGVSTPTELVKCRAQMALPSAKSSLSIARNIWRIDGVKGLFFGGRVTALRDSIGYGFYFWSYELAIRNWPLSEEQQEVSLTGEALRVMLCGGLAGIVTWASVFPLDVIKTRLQTQSAGQYCNGAGGGDIHRSRKGAWLIAREMFREGGIKPFFRGLTVCSIRAFVVNAAQWAVYERLMYESGEGRFRDSNGTQIA